MRRLLSILFVLLLPALASAQRTVTADAFLLNTGPCRLTSGSGAPSGGADCDWYVDTASSGAIYERRGGSWVKVLTQAASGGFTIGNVSGEARIQYDPTGSGSFAFANAANGFASLSALGGTFRSTVTFGGGMLQYTGAGTPDEMWIQRSAASAGASLYIRSGAGGPDDATGGPYIHMVSNADGTAEDAGKIDFVSYGTTSHANSNGFRWLSRGATDGSLVTTMALDEHGSLRVPELEVWRLVAKDVVSSVGGEIWTAETTTLTADLGSGAGDTTITTKENTLANGDRILLKSITSIEWMAVTSAAGGGAGAYTYSVTRDLDGTGRNAWAVGSAVVNTGTTGDGLTTQYASASSLPSAIGTGTLVGPTMLGVVRTGTTWSNLAPRWAAGNLNGLCGYSANLYGFLAGDCANAWLAIDPTNGVRLMAGATAKLTLAPDGSASFAGAISAPSGDIGGFTIGAGELYAGSGATRVEMQAAGGFWAGATAFADAPFSVGPDGALKATDATITGTITGSTITGSTATFGGSGGETTIDNDGITLTEGDGAANKLKWASGAYIYSNSNTLWQVANTFAFRATSYLDVWVNGDTIVTVEDAGLVPGTNGTLDLGLSSAKWGTAYLANAVVSNTAGNGANANVCADNDGKLYSSASPCSTEPLTAVLAEVASLRAEVARLQAAVSVTGGKQ